jgi:hypothetical protein
MLFRFDEAYSKDFKEKRSRYAKERTMLNPFDVS